MGRWWGAGIRIGTVALEFGHGRGVSRCRVETLSGGWSHGGWVLMRCRQVRVVGTAAVHAGARYSPPDTATWHRRACCHAHISMLGGRAPYVPYCPLD